MCGRQSNRDDLAELFKNNEVTDAGKTVELCRLRHEGVSVCQ